jgi:multidrug efflux pump subunit AcrB
MILVFRSYLQSVLVFSLIPFGILGAYVGHGLHGIPVNILSVYGLIALAGIVVNDSIVFIDQINRNLKRGLSVHEAVHKAGVSRLRPILLTTFTTVLGLAPLILETSKQAQFLIPMAVSVAYGLLIGTFLILIVLPSSYLVMNKFRRIFRWLISGNYPDELSVEPAIVEERNIDKWGLGDENEKN